MRPVVVGGQQLRFRNAHRRPFRMTSYRSGRIVGYETSLAIKASSETTSLAFPSPSPDAPAIVQQGVACQAFIVVVPVSRGESFANCGAVGQLMIGSSGPKSLEQVVTAARRRTSVCHSAMLNPLTTFVGVTRTISSPGTPLRRPYSSARSSPM
jgi:hypothetical protein